MVCSLLSTCNSMVCLEEISRSRSFLRRWFSFCKLLNWKKQPQHVHVKKLSRKIKVIQKIIIKCNVEGRIEFKCLHSPNKIIQNILLQHLMDEPEENLNVYIPKIKSYPEVWYLLIELLDVVYVEFQPRVQVLYRGYFALYLLVLIMSVKISPKINK